MWILECGRIFDLRPHKCFVAGVLDFPWACWQVSPQGGSGAAGFLGQCVNVNVGGLGQRVIAVDI